MYVDNKAWVFVYRANEYDWNVRWGVGEYVMADNLWEAIWGQNHAQRILI